MPNVTEFKEAFGSREATLDVNGPKVTVSYTRTFQILLDSGGPGADFAVMSHPDLPIARQQHPYDAFSRVKSVRVRPESEDDRKWIAEVQYATDVLPEEHEPDNPLDKPDVKEWGSQQFQRPAERDLNGKPIVNTAKEPFSQPYEIDDSRQTLSVSRNSAEFDDKLANRYRDAVNSDTFLGYPPGIVKLQEISAQEAFHEGEKYFQIRFVFHFRSEDETDPDWQLHVLNAGYRELTVTVGPDNFYKTILDDEGLPVNQPVPLNADGEKLRPDQDPIFLDFDVYRKLPFSVFNITD